MTTGLPAPGAVIAEDEPLLAAALRAELAAVWPELDVRAAPTDGQRAWEALLEHHPQVAFLDIRMPGMSGLEVAQAVAEDWPAHVPPPLLVFVTAYDAHAVQAFELAAIDYLLKPVRRDRLALTVARVRQQLASRAAGASADADLTALASRLAPLLGQLAGATPAPALGPLRTITAGVGNSVRLIPVDDVVYLQATDKYVNVVCADGEALVRASLAALAPRLDARFVQIHRGAIVNLDRVRSAERDEVGKLRLVLRDRPERLLVSRLHAHRFRPM